MNISNLIKNSDTVIVLAGAGLTAELGLPVYWTGDESKYGSDVSEFGRTALEHSHAQLWFDDPESQVAYFKKSFQRADSLKFEGSVYEVLKKILEGKKTFFVTSNTDSAFLNSGFDSESILEVHGAYRNSQCLIDPGHKIFPTLLNEDPFCATCGMIARPNVMFFEDYWFNPSIFHEQENRYHRFVDSVTRVKKKSHITILELGVGTTVPRIRQMGNRLYRDFSTAPFIHVNTAPRPDFLFGDVSDMKAPEIWVEASAGETLNGWL